MKLAPVLAAAGVGAAVLTAVTLSLTQSPTADPASPIAFSHHAKTRKLLTPHFVVDYSGAPTTGKMASRLEDRQTVRWPAPGIDIQDACDGIPDVAEYIGTFLEIAFREYCVDGPYPSPVPDGGRYTVYVEDVDHPEYVMLKGIVFAVGNFSSGSKAEEAMLKQATLAGDCFHEFFHVLQDSIVKRPKPTLHVVTVGPGWLYEGTATYFEGLLCVKHLHNGTNRVTANCTACFSKPEREVFSQGPIEPSDWPTRLIKPRVLKHGYGTGLFWSYLQSVRPGGKDLVYEFLRDDWILDVGAFERKVKAAFGRPLPELFREYAAANYYFARYRMPAPHCEQIGLDVWLVGPNLSAAVAEAPDVCGPGLGVWRDASIDAYGTMYLEISETWEGGVTVSVEDDAGLDGFYFDVYPGTRPPITRVPVAAGCLRRKGDVIDLPAGKAKGAVVVATRFHKTVRPGRGRFRLKIERNDLTAQGNADLRIVQFTHHVDTSDEFLPTHYLALKLENVGGQPAWVRTYAEDKHVNVDPKLIARRKAAGQAPDRYHLGLEWKLSIDKDWSLAPVGWTPSPAQKGDSLFEHKARVRAGQTRTFLDSLTASQARSYAFRAFLLDPTGKRIDQRGLDPTPRPVPKPATGR